MMIAKLLGATAAIALAAAPTMAAPVNPAGNLSVAKTVRAAGTTGKNNELAGGGLIVAIIAAAAVVAGIVIIADDDNSDSN